MTLLYRRRVAVEIAPPGRNARRIEGLRIAFRVERRPDGEPDGAEVAVWNPAPETLGALEEPATLTRIIAGYGDDAGQIAQGTIVRGSLAIRREGADRVASWRVLDGGYDLRRAMVAQGWVGAVRASEVIEQCRQAAGWARGTIQIATDTEYTTGYLAYGSVRSVLDTVTRDCGCVWSVQDGRLTIWPRRGERRRSVEVLSPDTGLIGSPQRTDEGIEMVALLRPGIRPGDVVRLDYPRLGGDYIARAVAFYGDTHGADFYVALVGVRA